MTEPTPVDSDVDLHVPAQVQELRRAPWAVLGAIAAGGALGALARFGLGQAFPGRPLWVIFGINVLGSLLIGALMVVLERAPGRPLLRPFAGVGVLGGFTTFSTYAVDIRRALVDGALLTAGAYLAGTLVAAVLATHLGMAATKRIFR